MVKLSIIIPVFNTGNFLNNCLNSILKQSFEDFEVICVDDGSTDNSLNILKSYENKDYRIKIFTQNNKGAGAARNLGLKHVNGEYILFADSDDWFEDNAFQLLYNQAKNLDTDLILFDSLEHKTDNISRERAYFNSNDFDFTNYIFDYHFRNNILVMNSFFVPWSKLYKAKFLLDNNIRFSEIPIFNDMYFNVVTTVLASKIAYYPKILYHYNKLNSSSIQSKIKFDKKPFVILYVYETIENFLKNHNLYEELEANFLKSKFKQYNNVLNWVNDDYKEELFIKFRDDFKNLELVDSNILYNLSLKEYSFYIHVLNSNSFREFNEFNSIFNESTLSNNLILSFDKVDENYIDFFNTSLNRIKELNLFDENYYIKNYNFTGSINPLIDYLCNGAFKNYNPSERFDTEYYSDFYHLKDNNSLIYFVNKGYFEGKNKISSSTPNFNSINKIKIDNEILNFNEMGISDENYGEEIIISLTSIPDRMEDLHYCLYSLFNQSFKPNKIILWLSEEEFPNKEEDIPEAVLNFKNNGLTIKWCKNYYSYKKLIPTLKKYPNACIVTVDDDLYYDKDCLKNLYEDHIKYPDYIIASRCRIMEFNEDNKLKRYVDWKLANKGEDISFLNFPTNGAGTLFPPDSLNEKVIDVNLFRKLCPHTDDIWFWSMAVLNKTKIKRCKKLVQELFYINSYKQIFSENKLWAKNSKGRNDLELNNVLNEFPEILKIIKD